MYITIENRRIDKITCFDYPKIVNFLYDSTSADLDGIDFCGIVEDTNKKHFDFRSAIYAILNDLQAKGKCNIDNLFNAISNSPELNQINFEFFNYSGYCEAIEQEENQYYNDIEEIEELEYERFAQMIDDTIEEIEASEAETAVFDEISDLDLAKQRAETKISDYLGNNWRKSWKDFDLDLIADIVKIVENVANTFNVDKKELLKLIPATTITRKKRSNDWIKIYGAYRKGGQIIIRCYHCKETKKTYILPRVAGVNSSFDYYSTLHKEKQKNYIAFSEKEALEKLLERENDA